MENEEINYLSNLAKLELTEEEKTKLVKDLDQIISYIDQLNELDAKEVIFAHETNLTNVGRLDQINIEKEKNKETMAENLKQEAFSREGDYFKVPPIFS